MENGICLIQLVIPTGRYFMLTSNLNCWHQEVPEGAPNCLAGLTFVISGTLDRYFCLRINVFYSVIYKKIDVVSVCAC